MHYGVDIASQRLDDLDKRVLTAVREQIGRGESVSVLDVGCGQGGLASALAEAGAKVMALDIVDYTRSNNSAIDFMQADISEWIATNKEQFDLVVMQRMLHYLPYADAWTVLEKLRLVTDTLYLSVTGMTTAIASHYEAFTFSLPKRWGVLNTAGQELFSITAPLCLYTEDEMRTLLAGTGWKIEWLRVSDFGNIKLKATLAHI